MSNPLLIVLDHDYRNRHWFHTIMVDAGLKVGEIPNVNARTIQPWDIEQRAPICILAMGDLALQVVRPGTPHVAATRGYVFEIGGHRWVVPTLEPSPKQLKSRDCGWLLVVNDIRKAYRIAERGFPEVGVFTRIFQPTREDVVGYFREERPLVVDIENTKDGRLVVVGFCDGRSTLVVPFRIQGGVEYWSATDYKEVYRVIQKVLSSWETIYQNGIHDVIGLEKHGFTVGNWVMDTMLGHAAIYPNTRHSLHHLGALYCERTPWKTFKQESASPEGELD